MPFMASVFFDSQTNHGWMSFDILFFLLCIFFQKKNLLKKLPLLICPLIYICIFSDELSCAKALFAQIFIAIAIFTPEKNKILYPICFCYFLLTSVFEAGNFFDSTFSMTLHDVWSAASFFWWGVVLFFLTPVILSAISFVPLFFYKRLNIPEISYFKGYAIFFVMILCVVLQSLFFPGKCFELSFVKFLDRTLTPGQISHSSILMKDAKDNFAIWNKDDLNRILYGKENILMVLVESWGANKNVQLTEALLDIFKDSSLNVKFTGLCAREQGHTQGAEWEDFETSGGNIVGKTLPMKMRARNFETWYVHGNEGSFYERKDNYKKFGFDTLVFKENFEKENLAKCNYGYEGVCDSSVVSWLERFFENSSHKFVYWTTLDAHPPYEGQHIRLAREKCDELHLGDVGCFYFTHQQNTLIRVRKFAKEHPEIRIIIKGDHRPMGSLEESDFVASFYYKWVSMVVIN